MFDLRPVEIVDVDPGDGSVPQRHRQHHAQGAMTRSLANPPPHLRIQRPSSHLSDQRERNGLKIPDTIIWRCSGPGQTKSFELQRLFPDPVAEIAEGFAARPFALKTLEHRD